LLTAAPAMVHVDLRSPRPAGTVERAVAGCRPSLAGRDRHRGPRLSRSLAGRPARASPGSATPRHDARLVPDDRSPAVAAGGLAWRVVDRSVLAPGRGPRVAGSVEDGSRPSGAWPTTCAAE
jgi:hypothetical protein